MKTKYGDTFKIGDPLDYVAQFPAKLSHNNGKGYR